MASDVDLYDVENALRELARARRRRDELTALQIGYGDLLASHMARHFGPEATETAGLALVIAGASVAALPAELPPVLLANIVAFAGQRLVLDARAADGA